MSIIDNVMDKKVRAILISLPTLMYTSLVYYILGFVFYVLVNSISTLVITLFVLGFIFSFVSLGLSIALIVIGGKNFNRDLYCDMSRLVMYVKIALIPWYIASCFLWMAQILGTLNPFLLPVFPLIVTISVVVTYVSMLSTTLINVGYVFAKKKKKELKMNKNIIVSIVFHFIECLDFVGAIILFKELSKDSVEEIKDVQ